ncbi:hypothetical protein B0H16DRAFT_1905173 [Mycena metata]|uniref:Uncharacterized protein n=1 Tax=Mycena metata TaxID=1033252 RepID=A0AAD7DGL4_9AGAR|nr:hypothetical protein B0H16DRAFT_1905173 [Mycena metata]
MPVQRLGTVPAHRRRGSSTLPPLSPPPSSSPRRSPSPPPRASSPDFPAYVMPGPEAEKALRKEQEPRRKQLNREIVRLQKKLASAPDNAVLQAKLEQSLMDYKDDFGTFIADKDFGEFAAERTRLWKARKIAAETGLLTSDYHLNPVYRAWIGLEATFFFLGLARQGGGDLDTMKQLALESFTVDLCNPYPQDDKRRAGLEATYREHLRYFAHEGYTVDSPSGTETKTTFQWTCHPESDENDLEDLALEGFGTAASKEAGILPAALFYGSPTPAAV